MTAVGIIAVAFLAAVAVLAPQRRLAASATLAAVALTPVLLLSEIWDSDQVRPLRDRPSLLAALCLVGAAAVAAAAEGGGIALPGDAALIGADVFNAPGDAGAAAPPEPSILGQDSFLVVLPKSVPPDQWPALAARICTDRGYCKVLGWTDPARETRALGGWCRAAASGPRQASGHRAGP